MLASLTPGPHLDRCPYLDRRHVHKVGPAAALAAAVCLLVVGCAADPEAAGDVAQTDVAQTDVAQADVAQAEESITGGAGRGGVSGLIASVADGVMQVQSTDSQTAVSWTDETVITRIAGAGLDQVTVGACVVAVAMGDVVGSDGVDEASGTDGSVDASSGAVTTVAISAAVDGECSASGLGAGGTRPEMPDGGTVPSDAAGSSDDLPSGGALSSVEELEPTADTPAQPDVTELDVTEPDVTELDVTEPGVTEPGDGTAPAGRQERGGFGQVTSGLVTAVSATGITVQVTGADDAVTTTTVEVDPDTTYTASVATDASAIVVGLCASARGETDDRGGMASTTLTLTEPVADGCTDGFGSGMPAPGGSDE
ncbi:hypothetical protein [Cellulomonas sp. KRMCY2]|uniref:hypothetical protein n=1 Tax=Cellulomonas sp. KRMCY2 TaxID=1304865 RepID=UPI00045E94B6|nr:hypothetical protein [Cellulomonas sp. KRMCY2]